MELIKETLSDLGFESREIKIYLALTRYGPLSALKISKETHIDRTTIYDILNKLIEKGIVSTTFKGKTKYFQAINSKKLLSHFKNKFNSLKTILPELKKITHSRNEELELEVYEGLEGIKTVLEDLMDSKLDYFAIGSAEEYENLLKYYNSRGVLLMDQLKVKETMITYKNQKFKKLKYGSYRYLDKKFKSNTMILIYGDKVAFFIWGQPSFAISIKNKSFSDFFIDHFNTLWKIAKK